MGALERLMSANRPEEVARNLALAGMISQVGCVTVVIVVGALLGGLWVDSLFNTKPLFTVLFTILSIPVSVYSLVRVALSTVAQFRSEIKNGGKKEGGA